MINRRTIVAFFLLLPVMAAAQIPGLSNFDTLQEGEVELRDLFQKTGIAIESIKFRRYDIGLVCRRDGCCPDGSTPRWAREDTNHDGWFDEVCVGVRYDPCNTEASVAEALHAYQAAGFVCTDEPHCPNINDLSFSPTDPACIYPRP